MATFRQLCVPLVGLAALSAVACGTHQAFEGPERMPGEVALVVPARAYQQQVFLLAVDQRQLGLFEDRAALLPGEHTLDVGLVLTVGGRQLSGEHRLRLRVQAGRVYEVSASWGLYGPRVAVIDLTTGALVAEALTPPPGRVPRR